MSKLLKYAVVTGGTKGIGKNICKTLLKNGYFVITNYSINEDAKKVAVDDFSEISDFFVIIKADFRVADEIIKFSTAIKTITNQIDCFVGNAATTLRKPFIEISNTEWEEIFRINCHSNFFLLRDLDPIMRQKASIIFVGALLGRIPHATAIAYGVSKSAMHALALNLVKEYSERLIRINVIAPGFVSTDWHKEKPLKVKNNIIEKTALKRFATVEEISHACMFLIENDFVNGTILNLDGGYSYK